MLCKKEEIQGNFTNHSLRAIAATRLIEARVDEQLIMQRMGHSSNAGVRSYERIGEKLRTVTSDVLNKGEKQYLTQKKQNWWIQMTTSN